MNSFTSLTQVIDELRIDGKEVKVTKLPSTAKYNRKSMYIKNQVGKSVARRMGNFN